jgi:hypothetical protein
MWERDEEKTKGGKNSTAGNQPFGRQAESP